MVLDIVSSSGLKNSPEQFATSLNIIVYYTQLDHNVAAIDKVDAKLSYYFSTKSD